MHLMELPRGANAKARVAVWEMVWKVLRVLTEEPHTGCMHDSTELHVDLIYSTPHIRLPLSKDMPLQPCAMSATLRLPATEIPNHARCHHPCLLNRSIKA